MSELHIARTLGGKPTHLSYLPGNETERALVESLPGARPQGQGKPVRFNVDRFVVDSLRRALHGELILPDDVQTWYDEAVEEQREFVRLTQGKDVALPLEVASKLRNYQRIGAHALAERRHMILADKQGLGKTLEALVATKLVDAQRVLIVTLSIAKWQWQDEIKHWLGEDAVVVEGSPQQRKALLQSNTRYLIIHYELLRDAVTKQAKNGKEPAAAKYPELLRQPWDVVIFDEAHKLQGRPTPKKPIYQSEAAEKVAKNAAHVFELTGTPIWNMPDSLWHLLHILDPQVLSSYWTYVNTYCTVEDTLYGRKVTGLNQAKIAELRERLSYYILQRTKEDVAPELPPKIFTTITYQLTTQQSHDYTLLKDTLSLDYMTGTHYFANAPAALVAMRALCNNPHDIGKNYDSPKDTVLLGLVTNILENERKVAILCWHVDYAHHISDLLYQRGISHVLATGETVPIKRIKTVETFKRDDTRVLVGNIAAIGTALNMAEISTAIFAELDWTPVVNEQATDRFHRLTSVRTVNIYYLIGEDTIEQHILEVTQKKAHLADQALAIEAVVDAILGTSS